jgi:hypothetical protein
MRSTYIYLKSRDLSYTIISQLSYIFLLAEEDDDDLYNEENIYIREKKEN